MVEISFGGTEAVRALRCRQRGVLMSESSWGIAGVGDYLLMTALTDWGS